MVVQSPKLQTAHSIVIDGMDVRSSGVCDNVFKDCLSPEEKDDDDFIKFARSIGIHTFMNSGR
jgi:hypothetical protein